MTVVWTKYNIARGPISRAWIEVFIFLKMNETVACPPTLSHQYRTLIRATFMSFRLSCSSIIEFWMIASIRICPFHVYTPKTSPWGLWFKPRLWWSASRTLQGESLAFSLQPSLSQRLNITTHEIRVRLKSCGLIVCFIFKS